ncbi:MAG: hypothetical protein U0R24_01755 [Solirubrobacterales bacterium]
MASEVDNQVVELESRQARVVLATTIVGVIGAMAGLIIQSSGLDPNASDDADRLADRADHFGSIIVGSIMTSIGYVLLAFTVLFLFNAVARRTDRVRDTLKPLIVLGPVLLAISGVVTSIGYDSVAQDFVNAGLPISGDDAVDRAQDLVGDSTVLQVGAFTALAGIAAFAFGIIYSSMWAMRVGLLTRFWGTLGMAFGAAFLLSQFLGPIGFLGVLFWMVHVALIANGRWMGGPLPAWETGTAVPWPDPKAPPPEPEPEESANPEDFEGSATEVSERPGRRDNKRKRKRKQRG